jgi:hypothetical protein
MDVQNMRIIAVLSILLFGFISNSYADDVWVSIKFSDVTATGISSPIATVDSEELKVLVSGLTSFGFIKLSKITNIGPDGTLSKVENTLVMGDVFVDGSMYIRHDNVLTINELHPKFTQKLSALYE